MAKLEVPEQSQTVQEQKKRLAQLEEGKAMLEKKVITVDSNLKSQEMKSREAPEPHTDTEVRKHWELTLKMKQSRKIYRQDLTTPL